ncbi:MAG: adenosyl-hopene transferase HpnH, partial [Dongiaceae bacterium]
IDAIRAAKAKGFRVNANATLFANADPERMANFFDACMDDYGIDMLTISPGYAYERAPDQQHFLNRQKTRELFRDIFRRDRERKWRFSQSSLFLDFLAGNQTYHCTPWSNPTRNVFGWQKPCYLLGEGYVRTFRELMETTEWDSYGTGRYEKCADCMVHCGYEGTAVDDTFTRPWKALEVAMFGIKMDGPMAPDIALDQARPAEYVFENQVQEHVALLHQAGDPTKRRSSAA